MCGEPPRRLPAFTRIERLAACTSQEDPDDRQAPRPSLDDADERRALAPGRVDAIELGGLAFNRATFEPGWRWSEQAGAASFPERHLGYLVSGRLRFRMDDGSELEASGGDVYLIPPGHDSWVVGDEACVALDLTTP